MLVLLGGDILRDGVGEPLLFLRLPVVCQREVDVGGKRLLPTGEPQKDGFCFVKLRVRQPRGSDANAGLEIADFVNLTLNFSFGAGQKVLADTFAVEPAGEAKNDFPGGIREFGDVERIGLIHARFATSTGKSEVGQN